jgi:uronate dehydrogenase
MSTVPAKSCRRVVVTGASGRIGRFLVPALIDADFEVSALDIVAPQEPDPRARHLVADMTNREELRRLLIGHDALVHLAANPLAQEWSEVEPANITGAVSVLETAGELGLDKLIFASSIHVCGYARQDDHFHSNMPVRPDGPYGVSKAFGEAVARYVHERFGPSVFVLRIGTCRARPLTIRERTTWISPPDLVRLVLACLNQRPAAQSYRTLWAFSANRNAHIDRSDWDAIGYQPGDDAENYLDGLTDPEAGTVAEGRIGGRFIKAARKQGDDS